MWQEEISFARLSQVKWYDGDQNEAVHSALVAAVHAGCQNSRL